MATSQPKVLRWWRGMELGKAITMATGMALFFCAALLLGVGFYHEMVSSFQIPKDNASDPVNRSVQESYQIPGLPTVEYRPGLADEMAHLRNLPTPRGKTSPNCRYWQNLSQPLKRGLAFVDAKAVPQCASRGYLTQARAEHRRRPQNQPSNYTQYEDLGNPDVPYDYSGLKYDCKYLTELTKYRYVSPSVPSMSPDKYESLVNAENFDPSGMTSTQKRELRRYNQAQDRADNFQTNVVTPVVDLYEEGGNFDKHCYPPGVVIGRNGNSVTFYPSHPVSSIREAAAPVFFSPSGSNTVGVGQRYVIRQGDSPASVATRFYDDYTQWPLIVAANNLSVPVPTQPYTFTLNLKKFKWEVGQVIYLPGVPNNN